MRSTINHLAKLEEGSPPVFTSFDPRSVSLPQDQEFHPTAADYFATCIPTESLDVWTYALLSPADIVAANDHYDLADGICRAGFVIFGRTSCGNFIAVEMVSGKCIELATFAAYEPGDDLRAQLFAEAHREYRSLSEFLETLGSEFAARLENDRVAEQAFTKVSDVDPNATDASGNTRLTMRILAEDLEGVRREVERGARLAPLSERDSDPVEDAITYCDSTAILAYLIERGAPVGPQALVWAADAMAYDHLDLLLAAGVNPESLPPEDREALLDDEDVVERLDRFFGG